MNSTGMWMAIQASGLFWPYIGIGCMIALGLLMGTRDYPVSNKPFIFLSAITIVAIWPLVVVALPFIGVGYVLAGVVIAPPEGWSW